VQPEKFLKGPENNFQVCAGLRACRSWIMPDRPLCNPISLFSGSCQYLGVNQGTGADHADAIKDFPLIQLKGAVDVADSEVEEKADELCPAPGIGFSKEVILSVEAVTAHYVVVGHEWQQRGHFADIELAIAVGVEDEVFVGGVEARLQGGAIAEIGGMVDNSYVFILCGDFVGYSGGGIGTAVVNNDYLVVAAEIFEYVDCLPGGSGDVFLLIVAGKEYAD
jgi:hypothetical protein